MNVRDDVENYDVGRAYASSLYWAFVTYIFYKII